MYRGRKFNSKKEAVKGPEGKYLGIQKFRFYIKCTACSRPVTFLTDPKNTDYEMESGATRNYEVHKDRVKKEDEVLAEKHLKEKEDPMKALENRVLASQREMADLDNLDEIKAMNMRHLKLRSGFQTGKDSLSSSLLSRKDVEENKREMSVLELDEKDEALVKSIKFGKRKQVSSEGLNSFGLVQNKEDTVWKQFQRKRELMQKQQLETSSNVEKYGKPISRLNPIINVKRKREVKKQNIEKEKHQVEIPKKKLSNSAPKGDVFGLLGSYSSDSE